LVRFCFPLLLLLAGFLSILVSLPASSRAAFQRPRHTRTRRGWVDSTLQTMARTSSIASVALMSTLSRHASLVLRWLGPLALSPLGAAFQELHQRSGGWGVRTSSIASVTLTSTLSRHASFALRWPGLLALSSSWGSIPRVTPAHVFDRKRSAYEYAVQARVACARVQDAWGAHWRKWIHVH
jgi:hypothetical protein